ncbi:YibE/F family protein [Haloimpatiens massiliensis]|uniref:YibE/F family protein n=1 Tax=Haloimpatiens massiliensis TaxID=1658110 RepID=UPI000C82503D|nr:YibE/F family protein [Haloimpatiens massiliensis]
MKKISYFRIVFTILMFFLIFWLSPFHNKNKTNSQHNEEFSKATVLEVLESHSLNIQKVKVMVKEGVYKGKEFTVENTLQLGEDLLRLKEHDDVVLLITGEDKEKLDVTIYEYVREKNLLYLIIFFILLVIIVGGIKGVHAISSVAFTICVISIVLLPGLVKGYNPIKLTIICSLIIAFFSLIIQQGFSKKTFSSLIGTLGGVTTAGIVTAIMSNTLRITINSEEIIKLLKISQNTKFDFQAILFSSIVIGALGANIDMSMSVATAMNEVKESNKNISRGELISCGMNVGRDVIGTMTNTLVLAYVGSSLVIFMIFMAYNVDLGYITNLEDISIEILRSLAGSIGIILSVPLTVFARAFME